MNTGPRWFVVFCMFLLVAGALAGCGGNGNSNDNGVGYGDSVGNPANVLVMATRARFAPFEFVNENDEYDGFDVDLAKEIAAILDMELRIDNMELDELIPSLQAKEIDMIISAMTIRTEEKVIFSEPYYNAGQAIVVRADNMDINGIKDLSVGKTIAVQPGTTGDFEAQDIAADENDIIRLQETSQLFDKLAAGSADAVIVNIHIAQRFMKTRDGIKLAGEPFYNEYFGIAIHNDNMELLTSVNFALEQIKDSGKYDELIQKWFK